MSDQSRPNVVFLVGDKTKVVFSENTSGPIIKPQWPLIFDLIDDPVAEWDLVENRLQGAWVVALARSLGSRLVAGELLAGLDVRVADGALDEGAQSLGEGR